MLAVAAGSDRTFWSAAAADDDARHHHGMDEVVGGAAQPAGVVRAGDHLGGRLGALVEVQPPQRHRAGERDHEGGQSGRDDRLHSVSVAPMMTIDSPSAIRMNAWQRSAKWPPSMVQSEVRDRPRPGV